MTDTACHCGTPYTMTPAEWKATHRDYKSIHRDAKGTLLYRAALRYCPVHGTHASPVTLVKEPKGTAAP